MLMPNQSSPFISTAELQDLLDDPSLRLFDASWHVVEKGVDTRRQFMERHIPGAAIFDIDDVADPDHALGHMLPSAIVFADKVGQLGVSNDSHVIAYDDKGIYSAARVWWMFRLFGHEKVSILEGGLPKWTNEGRPLVSGQGEPATPVTFSVTKQLPMVSLAEDVLANIYSKAALLIDGRQPSRFAAIDRDPYEGVKPGRVPGSKNFHWERVLDRETGGLLPPDALRAHFAEAGIDLTRPLIISCGSGVTACAIGAALETIGKHDWKVYDGAWDEWGRSDHLPIDNVPLK